MSLLGNYQIVKTIGRGSFGEVRSKIQTEAFHRPTRIPVALKFVKKRNQPRKRIQALMNQVLILSRLKHPYIIRLFQVIETPDQVIIVTQYLQSGQLYQLIARSGRLSQQISGKFFNQLVSALDCCHSKGFTHRDIKPQNILVSSQGDLRLADFGFAKQMIDGEYLSQSCGSPNYAAPQIVSGVKYCGTQVDIWSLGVVLFALAAGKLPFDEDSLRVLFQKIRLAEYSVPYYLTPELRDLIDRMLDPDPVGRISLQQIKGHPWVLRYAIETEEVVEMKMNQDILDKVLQLNQFNRIDRLDAKNIIEGNPLDKLTVSYKIIQHHIEKTSKKPERLYH